MLKFLIIIILSCINFSLQAEVINKIETYGNNRIDSETINVFLDINLGDDLNEIELNKKLKNLYNTNFFEDISIKLENNILRIDVKENPIINIIQINGIKSSDLKKKILSAISLKEKSPFIDIYAKNDLNLVKDILQQNGYYFSKATFSKKNNDNNTIDLILELNLGKKAFINKIFFIGDKKFNKQKLLNVITSEENKFWKVISNKKILNNERIQLDIRLLENFYKNKGYYNVKVFDEIIKYDDNQNISLIFNIEAGDKFYFGDLKINLPDDYNPNYFDKITNKLKKYTGDVYSFKIISKLLKEIEYVATDQQYEFIDVKVLEQITNNNQISIKLDVIDDVYKSYIQRIDILGNNITIDDVIRNQLTIDEGDPFNQILFNKSINKIKSLNIFKTVSTNVIEGSDESLKIVEINVEEKPTGEIFLGAGVGTTGVSSSFGVKENNFLGQGVKLDTNLYLSTETIRGLFSFTKPNLNNSDRDLKLVFNSQETDRIKDFGYKTNQTGFLIGTGFEYLEDLFLSPNFNIKYESIETSSTASSLLKKQEGNYFDLNLDYTFDLDKRDQLYQPTNGYRSIFYQKIPLNFGDNQTIINSYEITNYTEYADNLIATLSIFTKAANSLGNQDVRISERLYIPSRKLRGFESGKIGPVDGGDHIGGNYLTSFNLNTNLPIFPSLESISFNLFFDAANVWGVDYDPSINNSSALRSATGLGVDWYTPIGPLSFSLSQPITKKSTDVTESFRFNLGTTF